MTIRDYLLWRGDVPLDVAPFNPVDALILSYVMYSHFHRVGEGDGRPLREAAPEAERYLHQAGEGNEGALPEDETNAEPHLHQAGEGNDRALRETSPDAGHHLPRGEHATQHAPDVPTAPNAAPAPDDLMLTAAATRRLGGSILCQYADETDIDEEKQFAAAVFLTEDGAVNVVYRGTDDALVGWKEDFNLSFEAPVPAQRRAVAYLNDVAAMYPDPIRVMGHSKGGNLAEYAAAFCEAHVQARITDVYDNDGPGHDAETLQTPGYQAISGRIHTYIPKSSIVGMLLERTDNYQIIESDAVAVMQHDPKKWQVTPVGFVEAAGISRGNLYLSDTIRLWLKNLSRDERRVFTDTLFGILESTGQKNLSAIYLKPAAGLPAMLASVQGLDKKTVGMILEIHRQFLLAGLRVLKREAPGGGASPVGEAAPVEEAPSAGALPEGHS